MRLAVPKNAWLASSALAVAAAVVLVGCGSSGQGAQDTATLTKVDLTTRTTVTTASVQGSGTATVEGQVDLCGGPTAMPCRVYTLRISGCDVRLCTRLNEVAMVTAAGKTIATAPLRAGHFAVSVKPGTYLIEMLKVVTSRGKLHGQEQLSPPSEAQRVTVIAGKSTQVVFKLYAG
jgi:hypothetical protein